MKVWSRKRTPQHFPPKHQRHVGRFYRGLGSFCQVLLPFLPPKPPFCRLPETGLVGCLPRKTARLQAVTHDRMSQSADPGCRAAPCRRAYRKLRWTEQETMLGAPRALILEMEGVYPQNHMRSTVLGRRRPHGALCPKRYLSTNLWAAALIAGSPAGEANAERSGIPRTASRFTRSSQVLDLHGSGY